MRLGHARVSVEEGSPVGARSRVVAILVGGVVACGSAFVMLQVLSLLRPGIDSVRPDSREYAIPLGELVATLGAAGAGGFGMLRRTARGGMGQAVVLGVVLLVAFPTLWR